MGRLSAEDMLTHTNQETALVWHLGYNHFPPIPQSMLPVARAAIKYANLGRWDTRVALPEGATYRGKTRAPVRALVESLHLDAFLDASK